MQLVIEGVSHRGAPVAVRERVYLGEAALRMWLRRMAQDPVFSGVAILSTCNRTEFYITSASPDLALAALRALTHDLDPDGGWDRHCYRLSDEGALAHLFRVPAGLDSAILGEGQILGQFKTALREARSVGTVDGRLDLLMRRAISTAKRVRTETAIARNPVGFGHAAVQQARVIFGSLEGKSALMMGAGKMAASTARLLGAEGIRRIHFSTRTLSRAEAVAAGMPESVVARAVPFSQVERLAGEVDLIVSSTNSPDHVITREMADRFMPARLHRPLFLLDLAVPRDIDPEVADIEGAHLYNLDDLTRVVQLGLGERHAEVPAAESIVHDELVRTTAALAERQAAPTIASLVAEVEEHRRDQFSRGLPSGLTPTQAAQVERMTQALVARLLHAPINYLRENPDDAYAALLVREMFGLGEAGRVADRAG